jgi:hypothetical protein
MIRIIPYETVGQLRFGMTRDEVFAVLGNPKIIDQDRDDEVSLYYGTQRVTIGPAGMAEVGILPQLPVTIHGISVFSDPDAFAKLCQIDENPKENVGFIVLLNLGITMTGFHDFDESQKAITAFARGRWDSSLSRLKDFRPFAN